MESTKSAGLLISEENGILTITFNRPKRKNAITASMYLELEAILQEAGRNDEVRVIVFTGSGNFFSSGNEVSFAYVDEKYKDQNPSMFFKRFIDSLIIFPKLIFVIVNGPAIGIAVTMLPLCDIVYASEEAYFQTPFTKLALMAEGCSTYTFPRILGKSKAGDMLYMGYKMSAYEAKQFNFISDVYKPDRTDDVWKYIKTIATLSLESVYAVKRLVKKWDDETLLKVCAAEANELAKRLESPEVAERVLQFLNRRNKL